MTRLPRRPTQPWDATRTRVLYVFPKNAGEDIVAALRHLDQGVRLDLRVHTRQPCGHVPTVHGFALRVRLLPELERAIAYLRDAVERAGLDVP
jgi:hypothetical protein